MIFSYSRPGKERKGKETSLEKHFHRSCLIARIHRINHDTSRQNWFSIFTPLIAGWVRLLLKMSQTWQLEMTSPYRHLDPLREDGAVQGDEKPEMMSPCLCQFRWASLSAGYTWSIWSQGTKCAQSIRRGLRNRTQASKCRSWIRGLFLVSLNTRQRAIRSSCKRCYAVYKRKIKWKDLSILHICRLAASPADLRIYINIRK